ncbi:hypothetical protein [Brevibacillus choshinensis]|nr:hypothetical protein [Brevibacillus choshinensis]
MGEEGAGFAPGNYKARVDYWAKWVDSQPDIATALEKVPSDIRHLVLLRSDYFMEQMEGMSFGGEAGVSLAALSAKNTAKEISKLSLKEIKHVLNRHSTNSVKEQIPFLMKKMSKAEVNNWLKEGNRTFFNKDWTDDKILEVTNQAFEKLIKEGKNDGLYIVKEFGEDIRIYIEKGKLKSAAGTHTYTVDDLGF